MRPQLTCLLLVGMIAVTTAVPLLKNRYDLDDFEDDESSSSDFDDVEFEYQGYDENGDFVVGHKPRVSGGGGYNKKMPTASGDWRSPLNGDLGHVRLVARQLPPHRWHNVDSANLDEATAKPPTSPPWPQRQLSTSTAGSQTMTQAQPSLLSDAARI